jgi:hypothetical protein
MQIICHLSWADANIIFIMNVGINKSSIYSRFDDQRKVTESTADTRVLVITGSGTGKTHTLTYR